MTKLKDLHRRWTKDPVYKAEYDTREEFRLARALIEARTRGRLVSDAARATDEDVSVLRRPH